MKVDISEISKFNGAELVLEYNEVLENSDRLAEGFIIHKPISFKGVLTNVDGILLLKGKLAFDYVTGCFRCLKDVEEHVEIRISENYVNDGGQAEELDAYTYEGNLLDLDKAIEDNIILNLPMKKLCSQDCKGLCEKCGTNLNDKQCNCSEDSINPQMEKLRDYLKD